MWKRYHNKTAYSALLYLSRLLHEPATLGYTIWNNRSSRFAIWKPYQRICNPYQLYLIMGFAYQIKDQGAVHFVTFTVHQWADVFTRPIYADILLENIKYCQREKGLEIYAWVIMSNHCHLIIRAKNSNLSDIIRDFKKFTSKAIYKAIETNSQESRKNWLLKVLNYEGRIWFWEEGYHGEEIYSQEFFDTKMDYIHLNPVRAGIVEKEEEYLNSSAGDLYGIREGKLVLSEF